MNHLLIDFENIRPQNLDKLSAENTHIWLFLGMIHKMLPVELVQSLLRFGERAHIIRLQKTGKNALDFYLSYYLGQITAQDPNAAIGILSKDGGYDILVEHITANKNAQRIVRLNSIEGIEQQETISVKAETTVSTLTTDTKVENTAINPSTESLKPYYQAAFMALRQPDAFHPSLLSNLEQNLRKHVLKDLLCDKDIEEQARIVAAIIQRMKNQKFITIDESNRVSYQLSEEALWLKIQRYLFHTKPKSFADFQAAAQKRANDFGLTITIQDIQKMARELREKKLIRQNKGKIDYAPFSENPSTQATKNPDYPDQAIWQKVIAALSVAPNKRPSKLTSLQNVIKAHAKCEEHEVMNIVQTLQDKQWIKFADNKVVYLK